MTLLARVQIDRRLSGKAGASDVVQETFLRAHRAFDQFHGCSEGEFLSWLRQILVNQLTSLIRRYSAKRRAANLERQLQVEVEDSAANINQVISDPRSSPSEQVARRESSVVLADALQRLSEQHREVIILHKFEGLNFAEVGQRMGKSAGAAQRMWIRALVELRRLVVDDV